MGISGAVSVLGYVHVSPWLEKKFKLRDTCGVHNLHGLPGILGGIGGAISAASAGDTSYGTAIQQFWGARDPAGDARTAVQQGGYQFLALVTTLAFSILGGMVTGAIMQSPKLFNQEQNSFSDESH